MGGGRAGRRRQQGGWVSGDRSPPVPKAEVQKVFQKMFSSFRERSAMRRMRV